jgi:hypothetical protein
MCQVLWDNFFLQMCHLFWDGGSILIWLPKVVSYNFATAFTPGAMALVKPFYRWVNTVAPQA